MEHLKNIIRDIPDFPKAGILFRDITPLLADAESLRETVNALVAPYRDAGITAIAAMEARGFIFGGLAADALGTGFVPLRKPGKLPYETISESYDLEYGAASLEIHADALDERDTVLLIDDLIATGGTAVASCRLVERLGARVAGLAFIIELDGLNGRSALADYHVHSLVHY
ncbi:adenine phosphoribosyltransferase [Methylohalomonas lacus]|uniref:Adenine phosphoribosyltransferase n=1 Tax=Methylohalomonas lacus TaxID=398773 RepID=A0AAE3L5L6_9GAMM|nr:adenine phosphoribosyltransferase [Methylohalomonas lacus]MCS3903522.1 adenine phosphoribosyltransferase [Methylohalomonas lacus]